MPVPSDAASQSKADLLLEAAGRAARYLRSNDRPVYPTRDAVVALQAFDPKLRDGPISANDVVRQLDEIGSPATVLSTRGRYFGFVNGGTEPAAAAAAVLAGAWDQNVALPVMSPVAAHLDAIATRWVVELLGLPAASLSSFCAGASLANLTCILAARDGLLARRGWDVGKRGLVGSPRLRVVASAEIHVSALKAFRAAGIGTDAIAYASTDANGSVDPASFPKLDNRTLVVLQAGNVNTGHSDPFAELIPRAHDGGAWVHVDGAFGLWAAASPGRRHLVEGVQLADSWATDAHKWLNVPYDSAIAICAHPEDLRRSMAVDAAYLATDSDRALMHISLQMSQRARGIETWAAIAARGRSGIAEMVETACQHASRFAEMLRAGGADVLATVVLNQALVRFDDDATTDAVIAAVQSDGTCWAGGTTWKGRRAMRLSVSDTATTADDIERSAAAILACWNTVRADRRTATSEE